MEADAIISPDAPRGRVLLSGSIPISTRRGAPKVFCLAPAEPGGGSVSVVEPPQSDADQAAHENGAEEHHANGANRAHGEVDSRQYVREMINLSVELEPIEANVSTGQAHCCTDASHDAHTASYTHRLQNTVCKLLYLAQARFRRATAFSHTQQAQPSKCDPSCAHTSTATP